LLDENAALPQLVIIDGGKGQLSAAMDSIDKLGLRGKLTLVGLAKNKEELFFTGDSESLQLPWGSESLKLIRHIRDQVHRFGVTFHRTKRSKGTFKNELEGIKGIGKQTADVLLKEFRSVKKIREAGSNEIEALIGKSKADILRKGLETVATDDVLNSTTERSS
jgi:excinuclease ABC subunit C